jgi:hypothetical protein
MYDRDGSGQLNRTELYGAIQYLFNDMGVNRCPDLNFLN